MCPFSPRSVAEPIARREVYIAHIEDRAVDTFTLSFQPDRELWGDPPEDAGYVGRLAVDRDHADQDIGGQLLEHAGKLIAAAGRRWLRLDCAKHSTRLHEYYRAQRFNHLQTIDLSHRESGAFFERLARPEPDRNVSRDEPRITADHSAATPLHRSPAHLGG